MSNGSDVAPGAAHAENAVADAPDAAPPLEVVRVVEPAGVALLAPATKKPAGNGKLDGRVPAGLRARFDRYVAERPEVSFRELADALHVAPAVTAPPPFDVAKARYFGSVTDKIKMSPAARDLFRKTGVVSLPTPHAYSMTSAYHQIYTWDLPVLVTTDSILHALHRSYDDVLKDLERSTFAPAIERVLSGIHDGVAALAKKPHAGLEQTLADVDVYVTVARNLLVGAGSPLPSSSPKATGQVFLGWRPKTPLPPVDPRRHWDMDDGWDGALRIPSRTGQDAAALALLKRVAKLDLDIHDPVPLYGGRRFIDFSQFAPRGHYTESPGLQHYFRAMMWLGRVDTGFYLSPPADSRTDAARERRDAALLTVLLAESGRADLLAQVSRVIDFMVGRSDDAGPEDALAALRSIGASRASDLAPAAFPERFGAALAATRASGSVIRSQILWSDPKGPKVPPPPTFQLFGQRFLLDSFVLSEVVYDSIEYRKQKPQRMLPKGFDVMAALGNPEAVRLLDKELDRFHYGANLLAAARCVEDAAPKLPDESTYGAWLDALRTLDDVPAQGHFPSVMKSSAWQRKQLRTQLASWAELRHDNILYGKQSYSGVPACEYPEGFVEPYPALYDKVAALTKTLGERLRIAGRALAAGADPRLPNPTDNPAAFFGKFSDTVTKLGALARKELAATPFTAEETAFLKKTVDMRGGGSGPPTYDGWYPLLFYREPAKSKPTIADVHTDPASSRVLEVGVGYPQFLVVAIDNQNDRAVYVGPAYSYYEFAEGGAHRLTDEEWQSRLAATKPPAPPVWTEPFTAPTAP